MIENRIELLFQLKNYLENDNDELQAIKEIAERKNGWFTLEFINQSIQSICNHYLDEYELIAFASLFKTAESKNKLMTIGLVMAGNIPMVGFHDFLCVFLSGHKLNIKLSSKDEILMKHILEKIIEWDETMKDILTISDMLKGCDAYIATGSNHSANYFEYYFAKYPHIIRKNRTSVAILTGKESTEELEALADDVYQYYGLGCRNVTKLYVPKDYDFIKLLAAFQKYNYLKDHHKYRNNIDYNLAIYILNNQYYMSNESILLVESESIFSPISVLHYQFYDNIDSTLE